ncbi:reverse transcriptase-like protein [Novosphingobium profundi]|uniref:reverse transcriptase-like protein n=1 Tax=Novosphingobium profundi TaxID=1774954 RepID=UPI001CFDD895|nr:reverse transcriptase-like protein [Novosphingobium profundi]
MAGGRTKIYFDGGCRPNPGRMEAAVVVRGEAHLFEDMGEGGSFDAEWLALLEALDLACRIGLEDVVLLGDALAVVNEAQGVLDGGSGREPYATRLRELIAGGPRVRVRWIRRGQNLAGIALDKRRLR